MKLTDKIRTIGRKYIAPAILAGAVALGSYGCDNKTELPINQEIKKEIVIRQNEEVEIKQKSIQTNLDRMANTYWSKLESAQEKFNKYLSQRDDLTLVKQRDIFDDYRFALDLREEIIDYATKNNISSYSKLDFSKKDSNLYDLLYANLYDFDFGTPELEKKIKDSGIEISVERHVSNAEVFLPIGTVFFVFLAIGLGLAAYSDKKARRNEK